MKKIQIQTVQNIDIEYELASLGDRYVACLLDYFVIIAYAFLMLLIIGEYLASLSWITYVIIYLPVLFYHLICEIALQGQSIGKYLMKLKVVKIDGTQASIGSYILRWILRSVDITLTFGGLATLSSIITPYGQRIGDLAGGTTLVSLKTRDNLAFQLFDPVFQQEDYTITFDTVTNLTDQDIQLIKEALLQTQHLTSNVVLFALVEKVAELLGVTVILPPRKFLNIVVQDYHFIHSQ